MNNLISGFLFGLVLGTGIGLYFAWKFLEDERREFDQKIDQAVRIMNEFYNKNGWPLPDEDER